MAWRLHGISCAHAEDTVSFKAARRESQHGNLQHCLSQEKQHSMMRTIFATNITGRGQQDEFFLIFFLICVLKCRRLRAPQKHSPKQVYVSVF